MSATFFIGISVVLMVVGMAYLLVGLTALAFGDPLDWVVATIGVGLLALLMGAVLLSVIL